MAETDGAGVEPPLITAIFKTLYDLSWRATDSGEMVQAGRSVAANGREASAGVEKGMVGVDVSSDGVGGWW